MSDQTRENELPIPFRRPSVHGRSNRTANDALATELEAARLMIYRAADALDRADPQASMYSAMGKRLATDLGFKIVNDALQVHGGYGYLKDYGLEKLVRDLRVHQILEGTNEIMRVVVSRKLLGGNRG